MKRPFHLLIGSVLAAIAWTLVGATGHDEGKISKEMKWQPSQAANAPQVQFRSGHPSWTASEYTTKPGTLLRYYTVSAKKGQTLSVRYETVVTGCGFVVCRVDKHGRIIGKLMTRFGLEYGVTDWSARLPATGKYVVRVLVAHGGENKSSNLRITLHRH